MRQLRPGKALFCKGAVNLKIEGSPRLARFCKTPFLLLLQPFASILSMPLDGSTLEKGLLPEPWPRDFVSKDFWEPCRSLPSLGGDCFNYLFSLALCVSSPRLPHPHPPTLYFATTSWPTPEWVDFQPHPGKPNPRIGVGKRLKGFPSRNLSLSRTCCGVGERALRRSPNPGVGQVCAVRRE